MPARIGFLVFEGFQLLDASGPIAAFEIAGRYRPGAYELITLARASGSIASSSGASMNAIGLERAPALTRSSSRAAREPGRRFAIPKSCASCKPQ